MSDLPRLQELYLELANVVDERTLSVRDLAYRQAMMKALRHLRHATPQQRNGPVYQAADALRAALGYPPMSIGGDVMEGIPE